MSHTLENPTFQKIVALRLKLADAIEAGQPTGEIRRAVTLLEQKLIRERAEETAKAVFAEKQRRDAIQQRAAELAATTTEAIAEAARPFSMKD